MMSMACRNVLTAGGLRSFVKRGVDVGSYDSSGYSVMLWAIHNHNVELVKAAILSGWEVDRPIAFSNLRRDETALHASMGLFSRDRAIALALIEAGADVNRMEGRIYESSPLVLAVEWGDRVVIEALLARGADPLKGRGIYRARSAREVARSRGHHELVELFDNHMKKIHEERLVAKHKKAITLRF